MTSRGEELRRKIGWRRVDNDTEAKSKAWNGDVVHEAHVEPWEVNITEIKKVERVEEDEE